MASRIIRQIELYQQIKSGIIKYLESPDDNLEAKKKKSTYTHRIALSLGKQFPSSFSIDIDYMDADIVIRRGDEILSVILWSSEYLSERDKDKALRIHEKAKPILTLAFSPMDEKGYILIYRFEKDYLEYLHINKADKSERILKRCLLEGSGQKEEKQLLLGLDQKKRPQKRKKPSKTTQNDENIQ